MDLLQFSISLYCFTNKTNPPEYIEWIGFCGDLSAPTATAASVVATATVVTAAAAQNYKNKNDDQAAVVAAKKIVTHW